MVKVSAEHKEITYTEYLGACSYESAKHFEADGSYEDAVTSALEGLARELEGIANDHAVWEHDPIYCFWCITGCEP